VKEGGRPTVEVATRGRGGPPTGGRGRLGVFGGTFDPVHLGHLIIAAEAVHALSLDRLLFVPAALPPHKPASPISAPEHRVSMLEAAIDASPGFSVSRVDLDRPGPHYTVDMLRVVAATFPNADLFAIMGADSLRDLPTWRAPEEIVRLATLVVAGRPSVDVDWADLSATIPGIRERTMVINPPLIGISGTDIRGRVRMDRPIRHQVPALVEAYIRRTGLYAA
jgi:nicotinate-nucleotide adenylyltransferase